MSTTTPDTGAEPLDLTRAERWVLHDVMLRELEAAAEAEESPPWWAHAVLEQVEANDLALTCFEAWRIKRALETYVKDAPERDLEPTASVIDQLDAAYEAPPATVLG
ncbi:hypothetical protein [Halostella sp. PRR32]|uniref:DUF7853 family protein n=1 Tax=Halostella sp. PRR32 TaxID=3098147 RepID=UPI00110E4D2F|nr:hypothetical protein [Halostella sp. PRR32]